MLMSNDIHIYVLFNNATYELIITFFGMQLQFHGSNLLHALEHGACSMHGACFMHGACMEHLEHAPCRPGVHLLAGRRAPFSAVAAPVL